MTLPGLLLMLVLFADSYNTQAMVDTMSCNSLLIILVSL